MADYIHFGSGLLYQVWVVDDREARLRYLRNGFTGEELHFEKSVIFSFTTVDASVNTIDTAETLDSSQFSLADARRDMKGDLARLHLRFEGDRFEVLVTYEHVVGEEWIRKSLQITNLGRPVSVVGITLHDWSVKSDIDRIEPLDAGYRFAYPAYGASRTPDQYMTRLGMPAIVWSRHGGIVTGIEFPGSHTESSERDYRTDYRPGTKLDTGESLSSEVAVELAFDGTEFSSAVAAFTRYLNRRHPPRLPSPVRFNTCGAWLEQATEERVIATLPLAREMGAEVYVIDFGWSQYEGYPFSFGQPQALPRIEEVEQGFWRRELFPGGLGRICEKADDLGLRMGLHYETSGFPHVVEVDEWKLEGTINEGYCLCSGYGDQFAALVLHQIEKYRLGEIKLDFFTTEPCTAAGHEHLAGGYDSTGQQVLRVLELMRQARELEPDIVISLFTGGGYTSPWWLRHADQLHSGDPGHNVMFQAMLEDNTKSRAMALERRDRWHWATTQGMRPAHCVQMDVHGYGIQATGHIAARMDKSKDDSIPLGAGWKQTLFSNLALTQARDVKINPWYLNQAERQFVATWLGWAAENAQRLMYPMSLYGPPTGRSIEGYAHVDEDGGFVFLMNPCADVQHQVVNLPSVFGKGRWTARCLYPEDGEWGEIGSPLAIPAKDCVILEVAAAESGAPSTGAEDEVAKHNSIARRIRRPHDPLILGTWQEIFAGLKGRAFALRLQDADSPLWERRLHREAERLLRLAVAAGSSGDHGDVDASVVGVDILSRASPNGPDDRVGAFEHALGADLWRTPDGTLVDGAVVGASWANDRLDRLTLAATEPEHLAAALRLGIRELLADRGLKPCLVLDSPSAYRVTATGDAPPISPLHSRSVRIVSAVDEGLLFSLAEVVMGSSVKLGKPPSRRRGFLFLPAASGVVTAIVKAQLPAADQVVASFDVGLADQMAPSFGVNLADRSDGASFALDIGTDKGPVTLFDESVYPELYPSGEMLEYPQLLPEGLHNDFLRPMVVDLSAWAGQEVSLELTVSVGEHHSTAHCLPMWTPPTILRTD